MIRSYEPVRTLEPVNHGRLQWGPAVGAGLIAGIILLIVPHGSPWEGLTALSRTLMGRVLPPSSGLPLPVVWLSHLGLSVVYGLIISAAVSRVHIQRAVLLGALIGLGLYGLNLVVVSLAWPAHRTNEGGVILTHIAFGLIAAGAYRGLLRRAPA